MKKVLWIVTVLLMLSLTVVGCGDDAAPDAAQPNAEVTGSTETPNAAAPNQDTTVSDQVGTGSGTETATQPTSGEEQSQEQDTTAEQIQQTNTMPPVELPDDVFTEPENPTQTTDDVGEVTTKPTEPEYEPTETTQAATADTVPSEEVTETTFWGDNFDEGIELPMDMWD